MTYCTVYFDVKSNCSVVQLTKAVKIYNRNFSTKSAARYSENSAIITSNGESHPPSLNSKARELESDLCKW